ncbi:MAG: hypothetical protein ACE5NC_12300, partial [Anaerolineae bacterium]
MTAVADQSDITKETLGESGWLDITLDRLAPGRRGERVVQVVDLGRAAYEPVWRLQHELVRLRKLGEIGDVLLLV